jgi:aryl-alcohol dehydrogenase-like predicted oxidoreductase
LDVSAIGLGCNNFGTRLNAAQTSAVVSAARDSGVTFFDTADIYGGGKSEEFLGKAIRGDRDGVLIATKFGKPMPDGRRGARPEYIRAAAEASLQRLGTDVIDLYQVHESDPEVPIEETLGALAELIHAGKVREAGCSNFSVEQLQDAEVAAGRAGARFVSVQNEFSILERSPENGVLQFCEEHGISLVPYYPLASGLLTGKYRLGAAAPRGTRLGDTERYASLLNEQNLTIVERLIDFARARGHTILDLAFAWLLQHRAVASVIAGATKPEQIRANAGVRWILTAEEAAEVEQLVESVGQGASSGAG